MPEQEVPELWAPEQQRHQRATSVEVAIRKLIVIQALRPDRLPAMMDIFVRNILGAKFAEITDGDINLGELVEHEINHFALLRAWLRRKQSRRRLERRVEQANNEHRDGISWIS